MTIKEMPLVKAVSHHGPLPGFLFENPFINALAVIIACTLVWAMLIFILFGGFIGGWQGILELLRFSLLPGICTATLFGGYAVFRGLILRDQVRFHLALGASLILIDGSILVTEYLLSAENPFGVFNISLSYE